MESEMAAVEESRVVVDAEVAARLVKGLREAFVAGKTRSYEWRVSQLKSILKMAEDHEQDIADALRSDLAKPELESVVYEVLFNHLLLFFLRRKGKGLFKMFWDFLRECSVCVSVILFSFLGEFGFCLYAVFSWY
jgi:hypothetical protein